MDWTLMLENCFHAPYYHILIEVFLVCCIYRLFTIRPQRIHANDRLSEREKQQLIDEWSPDPLTPPVESEPEEQIVEICPNGKAKINKIECLNFGSFNFLNMMMDEEQSKVANDAIRKYGVGSCGPRGFFGTFDAHLDLEQKLADFLGVEEAILYSYGFATIASAIPAYAKKGDIIFADEEVSFAIQQGIRASRSIVRYFRHNDMDHLETLLKEQQKEDIKNPRKAKVTRKFVVIEGIYTNTGEIVPIDQIIKLKYKYKVRIFIDETNSFAVLGKTGKGVTEHFQMNACDIDLISAELERGLGSIGGFCAGSTYVIDHQRLSGSGYCFSASLPPYLAVAASNSISRIQTNTSSLSKLKHNCQYFHKLLGVRIIEPFRLRGHPESPIKHLYIDSTNNNEIDSILTNIINCALKKGIGLTKSVKIPQDRTAGSMRSIRIAICSAFTDEDIKLCVTSISNILCDIDVS